MSKTATRPQVKSTETNAIRDLQHFLTQAFTTATITVDEPIENDGVWALDLFQSDYHLSVVWQTKKGFGLVADEDHGYGEGADEVYATLDEVRPRIIELVAKKLPTSPPEAVRLKELRELRGLSQEELARRLGSKQASVSRLEARSDLHVSTLRNYAEALGAKLVVNVVFPDQEVELKFENKEAQLNLLVLRTAKLAEMRTFYSLLGSRFVDEQHGKGPKHCSAELSNGLILELYPCVNGASPDIGIRLGFCVDSIEDTLVQIKQQVPLKHSEDGLRAIVIDPEGRTVELLQKKAQTTNGRNSHVAAV